MLYKTEIDAIVKEFPDLTAFGFGVFDGYKLSNSAFNAALQKSQEEMYTQRSRVEFELVKYFLEGVRMNKGFNHTTSYGLKHLCENYLGHYVTNGMFIAGAYAQGFKVKRAGSGSPNAFFNMKKSDLYQLIGFDSQQKQMDIALIKDWCARTHEN